MIIVVDLHQSHGMARDVNVITNKMFAQQVMDGLVETNLRRGKTTVDKGDVFKYGNITFTYVKSSMDTNIVR